MLLGSWCIAGGVGILVAMLVVLPIKAFTSTSEVMEGTDLSRSPEHLATNVIAVRAAFAPLAVGVVTVALAVTEVSRTATTIGAVLPSALLSLVLVTHVRRPQGS